MLTYLTSKMTDFNKAKANGEIEKEIEVYPSKNILFCGNGIFEFANAKELDAIINREAQKDKWGGAE